MAAVAKSHRVLLARAKQVVYETSCGEIWDNKFRRQKGNRSNTSTANVRPPWSEYLGIRKHADILWSSNLTCKRIEMTVSDT